MRVRAGSAGVGGIADQLVPFVDGDLAGDDGRSAAVAFFENLEQVMTCGGIERLEPPVVEDEQLHAAERALDAGIATVAAGERKVGEELGNALVEHRTIVAAGFVAERRGEPALADAGRSAQDQVVVRIDPGTLGELLEQRAVEAARCTIVDVLDGGLMAQPGIAQAGVQPSVTSVAGLLVEQ